MKSYNSYSHFFRERKTKKGIVYDVRFRIIDEHGYEVEKALCGYQTKSLAKQAYAQFMSEYTAPPINNNPKKNVIKYDDLFEQYLVYVKANLKESSCYEIQKIFQKFVTPYFSAKNMDLIDKSALIEWQDRIWSLKKANGEAYSYAYVSKIRALLSAFLQWSFDRYGFINYLPSIKKPKRRQKVQLMKIWEEKAFETFFSVIDHMLWKTFFMVLYYTGCRIGEVLAMRDEDVGEVIVVSKNLSRKTLDEKNYKITTTKNEKIRRVPIPKKLLQQLEAYLEWKNANSEASTFLFGGNKPLAETTVRRIFDEYTLKAALPRIRIHDIRHSYVSLLIHKGANLTIVADLLGDTLDQVVKTYAHMYASDKAEIISLLDG